MVESQIPLKCGRVKNSINLIESWIPLKYSRVKESIDEFDLVESKTLVEKTLNQNLRKFLLVIFK